MALWRRRGEGSDDSGLGPVTATVLVARPPDWAFEWFTNRIGRWWPTGHTLDPAHVVGVRLDGSLGGRLLELHDDGTEHAWASVVGWRPPVALSLAWTAHAGGGRTEVDVTFEPAGSGSTWLRLEHRGWAGLGPSAVADRESYRVAWPAVLGAYLDAM